MYVGSDVIPRLVSGSMVIIDCKIALATTLPLARPTLALKGQDLLS